MNILEAREMADVCFLFSQVDFISSSIGQAVLRSDGFSKGHSFTDVIAAFFGLKLLFWYHLGQGAVTSGEEVDPRF